MFKNLYRKNVQINCAIEVIQNPIGKNNIVFFDNLGMDLFGETLDKFHTPYVKRRKFSFIHGHRIH